MSEHWTNTKGLIKNIQSLYLSLQICAKERGQWGENLQKYNKEIFFLEKQIMEQKMKFEYLLRGKKVYN